MNKAKRELVKYIALRTSWTMMPMMYISIKDKRIGLTFKLFSKRLKGAFYNTESSNLDYTKHLRLDYIKWLRDCTSEDLLLCGFSEHEVMELFR